MVYDYSWEMKTKHLYFLPLPAPRLWDELSSWKLRNLYIYPKGHAHVKPRVPKKRTDLIRSCVIAIHRCGAPDAALHIALEADPGCAGPEERARRKGRSRHGERPGLPGLSGLIGQMAGGLAMWIGPCQPGSGNPRIQGLSQDSGGTGNTVAPASSRWNPQALVPVPHFGCGRKPRCATRRVKHRRSLRPDPNEPAVDPSLT